MIITTLQDGTKDESAILVIYQKVVIYKNLVDKLEDQSVRAIFNKALDDSATIFMFTIINYITVNFTYEIFV